MHTLELNMLVISIVTLLVAVAALVVGIRAYLKYDRLYKQYDYFMRGKDAESLEEYFIALQEQVEKLQEEDAKNKDMMRVVNRNIRASFQKFGIIRYNAFAGMGGSMSFALAMLDYTNTGFVLNCVHSREGCFMYVKDVEAGTTSVELGSEERNALEQALGYREREQQ